VELRVEGERTALPPGLDLTAYRLVQEGLTNALKHARASKAQVLLRYEPNAVEILVSDDGRGGATSHGSAGHGLIGKRERVSLYAGQLSAGPRDGGGFELRAQLPLTNA
jgi:signal transduction histidine kinase